MQADTPPPPRPALAPLRLLLPLLAVAALLGVVVLALGGGAAWLLRSEAGTQWLLARVPGLQVAGARGALLGERFAADRVRVEWGPAATPGSLTITGLRGEGLRWSWRPAAGRWVGLDADTLAAQQVVLALPPAAPSAEPATAPDSLVLPLRLRVARVHVAELRIDTLAPLRDLGARLRVGETDGHHIEDLALAWDQLTLTGQARLADTAPFGLAARVQAAPADGSAWAATLLADGVLARIGLQATLRGAPAIGGAAPAADISATLQPFAPWPLAALSATTAALDLSTLASALPQTRLDGSLMVQSRALDAPIAATLQLQNSRPGRWNENRLPVRQLSLSAEGSVAQRDRLLLRDIDLLLADATREAGRWRGQGEWAGTTLQLDTTLAAVQPQRLDGRAAAMTLSGPLAFTVTGLPSLAGTAAASPLALSVRSTLEGRLDTAPQAVKLLLDATAAASRIEVRQLRLQSGGALAQASGQAQRGARGGWQLRSAGSLADFDPLPWWPGAAGSAWRQGPHRLSADWQLDVRLPPGAEGQSPLAVAQAVAGSGTLRIHDSVLAGVPLALTLALGREASTEGTPSTLRGEMLLGSNRLAIDAQGDPAGDGSRDRVRIDLDGNTLAALAPLVRLEPALAAWAPRGGNASATLTAQGRWPRLRSSGQVRLQQLDLGELAAAAGDATWNLDMGGTGAEPLSLRAQLSGLRLRQQRADTLQAELRGTLADHRLTLSGALPLSPAPLVAQVLGLRAMAGTQARLQAEGGWLADPAGGGRWRGRVAQLSAGPWDGRPLAPGAAGSAAWADGRDLRAEFQFDAAGQLQRVQASPGRVRLADAVALRWDAVLVDLRGSTPQIDLRADIEAFTLAPLLERLQPGLGWGGDLRLGGRLAVRAADRFDADVVFERVDGDLHLREDISTQLLGLTDFRLALAAHDGQWIFTQALAGRTLGEMAGSLSVRTTPQQRWPEAEAPIEGVLQARVANLGIWGGWVPAGWRLSGELSTSATIGGRFGAPEYTGQLLGRDLGVRNLLQGVNLVQGQVAVKLQGATAEIERFTFKGGDGTLALSGGAEFGSTPNARLQLTAERFRLLGRIDRQLTASGTAALALRSELVKLDGNFVVDEGLFDTSRGDAPGLDDDVTIRRATDPEPVAEAETAPPPRRDLQVAVDIDLGDKLRVRGRGLDTALRGQLRVSTPGGRLAINGTVNTQGGTYAAYGQKLDIERGIIAFSGPADSPRLDILALRDNTDTRVGVAVSGSTANPRVRLYSETDMSDTDKLSWLVLGRAPDGLGRTDTALLQRAAFALLAGEGEAPTDTLMKNLGLDEVSLRQSDGEVRETVISLGKQLSRRWYVGYERGVNATAGTWQLVYRIAQRFTLRAQSGEENSLDIIWVWRVDDVALLPGMPVRKSRPAATPP